MIYISKGTMIKEEPLSVIHAGKIYELDNKETVLWLSSFNKERGYGILHDEDMKNSFNSLISKDLIVFECEMKPRSLFKMLCKCILIPVEYRSESELTESEKELYTWLTKCAAVFSAAELVAIKELGIHPSSEYIGPRNYQKLISKIYFNEEMVLDNSLEYNMMFVDSRDDVVSLILSLVRKGAIVLA